MVGLVLAFSGAIGSGKSSVTKALAANLGYPRVSFGEHVREVVAKEGLDPTDRAILQDVGQRLVLTKLQDFVRDVLARADWCANGHLIIDGLRHVEVLMELKRQVDPRPFRLVHIRVDEDARQERLTARKGLDPRLAQQYDKHVTEAQIREIIPQYADRIVDGNQPFDRVVEQVVGFVGWEISSPHRASEALLECRRP